jgi:hypothetical protein
LARAHAVLLEDLQNLENVIRAPASGRPARLATQLRRLRRHLGEHFRFEERDGYMSAVRKREPQLDREVTGLLAEHRQLAKDLDALRDQARQDQESVPAAEIQAWIERVRSHEARENALVEEVFNRDTIAED